MSQWNNRDSYLASVTLAVESGCKHIGVDAGINQLEYPFEALVLEREPDVHFTHVGVSNPSEHYRKPGDFEPCVVWCPDCAGIPEKLTMYRGQSNCEISEEFVVFSGPRQ